MIIHVLACDFDGTIAEQGRMADATLRALERVRESGRKLVLVTGRTLSDLESTCPVCERLFDAIVGKNGAVLYLPGERECRRLGEPPEPALLRDLRRRGVVFSLGTSSIHTSAAFAEAALLAIRATGVDRALVFNRNSLMLLPAGVTKGSGLEAALGAVEVSPHNAIGIGDAENDHAVLALCELGVAVADAVPALRERADYVTRAPAARGVVEFIEEHLLKDLADLIRRVPRHRLRLGEEDDGTSVTIPAHGVNLLVLGPSGSGKSTVAGVLVERLVETGRSVCVLDPEGDYQTLGDLMEVVVLGQEGHHTLPTPQELEQLLRHPRTSLVLNLSAMSRAEKVTYGTQVLAAATAVRGSRGTPHWIMLDEAHHLMPPEGSPVAEVLASAGEGICLITLAADGLPPDVLASMNMLASTHLEACSGGLRGLAGWPVNVGRAPGGFPLAPGEMVLGRADGAAPRWIRFFVGRRRSAHQRHLRKYAEGELPPDRSFYFRGSHGELNLRAINLTRFCELAEGVDEATWEHHRQRGEYSTWLREMIKDPELGQEAEEVERADRLAAPEARRTLLEAIRRRYAV
ncbi:MAG TPA: HAD hydrolase family protein [Candidatus Methylomirabilis sp.]|nr:HAD hydrolase family protein [Candidatus Methylomirabilis sp.]